MRCIALLSALFLLLPAASLAYDSTIDGNQASPPPGSVTRDPPTLVLQFDDPISMHNMSITSDGSYYYTMNGGNAGQGTINTYDLAGVPVNSVACGIDARAILCDPTTGDVYVKGFDRNWYSVDPATGGFTVVFAGMFQFGQSTPTMTPDGMYILEHEEGTIHWYDASTGLMTDTQTGYFYGGYPSSEAVATDGQRIFTWDGTLTYVYDMGGAFIESWNIPYGHYGFSLGWANGLLWSSQDGGGGTGTWYGYDVGGGATPVQATTWSAIKKLFD